MKEIQLQLPTLEHQTAAEHYKQAFFDHGEPVINGSGLLDQMAYEPWLIHTINTAHQSTVSKDWVVATTFFAIRKQDQKIIGMIDIRHNLDNDFLRQYGGHIGYSVHPNERRKGYATQMLKLALAYAKFLGLKAVMLGCYADNIPSAKTIEKCGGILTETKLYTDGKAMAIYWIDLP